MMRIFKTATLSFICALMLIGTVHAEEKPLKGIKLGFGFDRGFGIVGTMGKFNGFIGNDGVAVDYILNKETLKLEVDGPVFWYVGAGGYGDWDGDLGVRLPVGAEWYFAENLDAYAQVIPRLRVNHNAKFGLDFGIGVRYQF
jgi:hypothetical protein